MLVAAVLFLGSLSAWGGTILFSDLGSGSITYNCCAGAALLGSANSAIPGEAAVFADLFTISGTGAESVSQIDFPVGNVSGLNTFTASIWTDSSGAPGSEVSGAFWSLSTNAAAGTCCALITVAVSGVTLTGGQQYFMVLGPANLTDDSYNAWEDDNQGLTGTVESSGTGAFFNNGVPSVLSAFDVLGTPEPTSLALSAAGLAVLLALRRSKTNQ